MTNDEAIAVVDAMRMIWRADRRWDGDDDFATAYAACVLPFSAEVAGRAVADVARESPGRVPQPAEVANACRKIERDDRVRAIEAERYRAEGTLPGDRVPTSRWCLACDGRLELLTGRQPMLWCERCRATKIMEWVAAGSPRVVLTADEVDAVMRDAQ